MMEMQLKKLVPFHISADEYTRTPTFWQHWTQRARISHLNLVALLHT